MKFYQSKIFKIIMGLIAIIIIFKYSFLIFLAGIGLVVYLNKNNVKFKSFHKAGKIILSSFIILFALLAIGIKNAPTTEKSIATSSKVETSAESAKPVEKSEVTEDTKPAVTEEVKPEVKDDTKSQQPASNDTKTQTANNSAASTNSSTVNNNASVKSAESTNTNSANSNSTTANTSDENTIVYCVPKSNVYHLSKSDSTLKKSKNIYEITLKEAKAKGMHQSDSKADN
jgi:cytoskeletal protein RodZ